MTAGPSEALSAALAVVHGPPPHLPSVSWTLGFPCKLPTEGNVMRSRGQGPTLIVDGLSPEQAGDVSCPGLLGGQVGGLKHEGVPGLAAAEPNLKAQVVIPTALGEAKVCHLCGQERGSR